MPTQEFFNQFPPFPEDLPTLPMPRLSYGKLLKDDVDESSALWDAAITHGFFLMDFSDSPDGLTLIDDVVQTFGASRRYFEQSDEKKGAIPLGKGNVGYKPVGSMNNEDGRPDLTEMCNIAREDLVNATEAVPEAFRVDRPLLASTAQSLHAVTLTVLAHLARHLELPPKAFDEYHDPAKHSVSVMRFLRYPPQTAGSAARRTSLLGHTDNGTLTVLFTALGGLQVLPTGMPDAPANWRWVRPEANCAIVNVGDSLVQWTGGVLTSSFHRVFHAPGAQADHYRFSLGYFLKPAEEARMDRIRGGKVPALTPEEEAAEASIGTYETFHAVKYAGIQKGENSVLGGNRGAAVANGKAK